MRATMSEFENSVPSESFLGVLDQFAALRTYSTALPAVGGYRLLAPRGHVERKPRAIAAPITAALARARLRLTGFLSVLFVGALGLAVLAGPANCPDCGTLSVNERTSLARLGYIENAHFITTREPIARDAEVRTLAAVAVAEPEVSATGTSPITTSSLEPSREAIAPKHDDLGTVVAGGRPTEAASLPTEIDAVADAGPPVRLAAATISESDVPSTLPVVTVTAPPLPKVTSTEAKAAAAEKSHAQPRKRVTHAYRAPVAKPHAPANPMLTQRAPRWAQQMYVTPWQSQAFSYTR